MWEAYSVGITLKINDLVTPKILELSKEFAKLDVVASTLAKSIDKISIEATGMRRLTIATNDANRAFERAALSAASFQRQLSAINASGALGRPGGGGGSRGGMHGGNIHVGPGGIGLGSAGIAAGDWFWPLAATGAAAYGGKALYESAKDLNTEQNKLRLFGMTDAQNNQAFEFVKRMKIFGTTQAENMASFTEAQGVGRESGLQGAEALKFAMIAAPVLAKMDALGIGLDAESRGNLHASNVNFLRFAEQSGAARDTDTMLRLANQAYKIAQSSGGTVNYASLKGMTQKGGVWTQNMTDAGFGHNEPLIAEMGGDAYGTAMSTAGARLSGGIRPTNAMMHEYFRLGIWDPSKVALNSKGGFDHFVNGQNPMDPAALQLFASDFSEFYRTYLKPKYDAVGGLNSIVELGRENNLVLGRTGGRLGNLAEKNLPIMDNALTAYNKAMDIDQAGSVLQQSLAGKEAEFTAAWTDFKTDFGTKMLPFFTNILKIGDGILRDLPSGVPKAASAASQLPFASIITSLWDLLSQNNSTNHSPFVSSRMGWRDRPPAPIVLKVDGRVLAQSTAKQMDSVFLRPQTGLDVFDSRSMPTPAGGGY